MAALRDHDYTASQGCKRYITLKGNETAIRLVQNVWSYISELQGRFPELRLNITGYEVVIVKGGLRTCGAGAALGNAPLVQSKSYFEVKVQQGGSWSVGLASRQTDLSLTQGGMDEYSWALCDDHIIRHNKEDLYKVAEDDSDTEGIQKLQESGIIGVAYDHIQLKFFVNGKEVDYAVTSIKGTVYPALYVDDGAILDIVLENFNFSPPPGFEKIMLEQSIL